MDDIERVAQYKREQNYPAAIELLEKMIDETEADSSRSAEGVDPRPYKDMAIVRRKMKDYEAEVAILERFARQSHNHWSDTRKLLDRLGKAYELAGQPAKEDIFYKKGLLVDAETTGLSGADEIIELALILFEFDERTGLVIKEIDSYSGLREPAVEIDKKSRRIHGLSMKDVKGKKLDKTKVKTMIDEADMLMAHNASFDRRFLVKLFPVVTQKQWYCTMNGVPWARYGYESKKLDVLLKGHGIELKVAHRAMSDLQALLTLMQKGDEAGQPYLLSVVSDKQLSKYREEPEYVYQPHYSYQARGKLQKPSKKKANPYIMAFVNIVIAIFVLGCGCFACGVLFRG